MFDETQLQSFIDSVRKVKGENTLAHGLRSLEVNPHNPDQVNRVIGSLEHMARKRGMNGGRQVLDALEAMAKQYPEAVKRLGSLSRTTSGQKAIELREMANGAFNDAGRHHPTTYMNELYETARRGGELGKSAFDKIAQAARNGSAHGRQLLEKISQPGQQFARQATQMLRQLGPAAGTAVVGASASVPATTGAMFGAKVGAALANPVTWGVIGILAAAGLLGGYYWSQQPDSDPVKPGPRMAGSYEPPVANVPIETDALGPFYVVRITGGSYDILSIRSASAVEAGISNRNFRNAGMSPEHAELTRVGPEYSNTREAAQAVAAMIEPGTLQPVPRAAGHWAKIGGKRTVLDDRGSIDLSSAVRPYLTAPN